MLDVMTQRYATSQGDTWDSISRFLFGTHYYMHYLMEVNTEQSDVLIFGGGVRLYVPILEVKASSTLPPWKQE